MDLGLNHQRSGSCHWRQQYKIHVVLGYDEMRNMVALAKSFLGYIKDQCLMIRF
jgi:hypothetical protein